MSRVYQNYTRPTRTPQSQPIPGRERDMTPNNAGGYGFTLDKWERLHRFLILGSDGGTYYVDEQKLTMQNAGIVIDCLDEDGPRVVAEARAVNVENRAPKVDQQLFVIALALRHGDNATKQAVREALPDMLRTGTHVLHLAAMLDGLGGWCRAKRRVIADWFTGQDADRLAWQVLKYRNRDAWSMRDLLRVSHPVTTDAAHKAVFDWICGRKSPGQLPELLESYDRIMLGVLGTSGLSSVEKALRGIDARLPREALPTEALADPDVWRALLPQTPPHALLRNLGTMTANLAVAPGTPEATLLTTRLRDADAFRKARVHPFAVLLATLVYKQGQGVRSTKTWTPINAVLSALEDAYDAAFAYTKPTGKRILVCVDVSGSMSGTRCVGTPIPAASAAAAMAITLARLEPKAVVVRFDTTVRDIMTITARTGIASIERATGGGTDCASPILWASAKPFLSRWGHDWDSDSGQVAATRTPLEFDAFVFLTDGETWAGQVHAQQALADYRRQVVPGARIVCCAMAANRASIIDPRDPLALGCAGLDANLPSIVSEFIGA